MSSRTRGITDQAAAPRGRFLFRRADRRGARTGRRFLLRLATLAVLAVAGTFGEPLDVVADSPASLFAELPADHRASGVAVDGEGNVYVHSSSPTTKSKLWKFDSSGELLQSMPLEESPARKSGLRLTYDAGNKTLWGLSRDGAIVSIRPRSLKAKWIGSVGFNGTVTTERSEPGAPALYVSGVEAGGRAISGVVDLTRRSFERVVDGVTASGSKGFQGIAMSESGLRAASAFTLETAVYDAAVGRGGRFLYAISGKRRHEILRFAKRATASPERASAVIGAVVNAASNDDPISPGQLISIYGSDLISGLPMGLGFPLPTDFRGTRIEIAGHACPFLFVSAEQINAQLPPEVPTGRQTVRIETPMGISTGEVEVAPASPGLFVTGGRDRAVALHGNGLAFVDDGAPAQAGETIVLYGTGIGPVSPMPATGAPAAGAPLSVATSNVRVEIGGLPAAVHFAGLAPGFLGLMQLNVEVPANVATTNASAVVVTIDGRSSRTVFLSVLGPGRTSPEPAQTIQAGQTVNGSLSPTDGPSVVRDGSFGDRYAFTLSSSQRVRIEQTSSDFDTFLILLDANATTVLAVNDDGGPGLNSRIEGTLSAGTYVIEASSFAPGATGAYRLSLEATASPPDPGPAQLIQVGQTVNGALTTTDGPSIAGDGRLGDRYRFTLASSQRVRIEQTSGEFDTLLILLDEDAAEILAVDDDGGEGLNSRIEVTLTAGTYLIEASSFGPGVTGGYRLSLEAISNPPDPGPTQTIRVGQTVDGALTTSDGPSVADDGSFGDRYRFTLGSSQRVRIDLSSSEFDTFLILLDANVTTAVAVDDDGGPGLNSQIEISLDAGTYVIEASSFRPGATGAYRLSLRAVASPPDPTPTQAIRVGQTVNGSLTPNDGPSVAGDGSFGDLYRFTLGSTQPVRIDQTSSEFDTFLILLDANATTVLAADDDSGTGLNSRIEGNLDAGTYVIEASSFAPGATGAYRLSLTASGAIAPTVTLIPEPRAGVTVRRAKAGGITWVKSKNAATVRQRLLATEAF